MSNLCELGGGSEVHLEEGVGAECSVQAPLDRLWSWDYLQSGEPCHFDQ
jgi:hypothetical protein